MFNQYRKGIDSLFQGSLKWNGIDGKGRQEMNLTNRRLDMTNLATDFVKVAQFNRKPSASSRRAGATVNVVDIVSEEKRMDLSSREAWAVKRFFSIEKTQAKQLVELKEIGQVILDIRSLYKSDTEFKKAVEDREIGKIPYGNRYIMMSLADLWSELEPKLGTEGYTSKSAETLVKALRAEKRKNGEDTAKRPSKKAGGKAKTQTKSAKAKPEVTKAQVLAMLQAAAKAGVIVKDDLATIDWTVTK